MQLSVQCWTLRDCFAKDVDQTLRDLSEIGLEYVELAGTYGLSPADMHSHLDDFGLKVSGMHVGLGDAENGQKLIDEAKTLGCPWVIVPWVSERDYAPGWDVLGKRLEAAGRKFTDAGIGFAYHNHAFEFVDAKGKTGFDTLFAAASPDVLKAEIDLWWAYVGNEDPADLVRRHAARTPLVHIKDGSAKDNDIHQPVGSGVIDWLPVLEACFACGVEYGVIELDTSPGDPMEAVRQSFAYLKPLV